MNSHDSIPDLGDPSGIDIAIEVFHHNVHEPGSFINLKEKQPRKKTYTGYYQGAFAGIMSLVAYGMFVLYRKEEIKKSTKTSDESPLVEATEEPSEQFVFQI